MATNANVIQAQLAATTAPYEAQLNNLRLDFEAAKKRQAADNAARLNELYIAHEQNKRTLPQQNAALGNTGGLTETSIIDLANTYQRNRNAQNKSYTDAIAELDLEYAKSRNTINAQIAAAQAAANAKLAALKYSGTAKKKDDADYLIAPGTAYQQLKDLQTAKTWGEPGVSIYWTSGRRPVYPDEVK